jgi:predicted adenine nucleotide alpha hydrolase (AANH) superfamily ATPase
MSLLLHLCCAPCLIYPEQVLTREGIAFSGYFYNPNIHPYKEFRKRMDGVLSYCQDRNIPLIVERDYGLREFLRSVVFKETSRCPVCYQMRLEKTAQTAQERGFEFFSTTLLYSKYQNHSLIKNQGDNLSGKKPVSFIYRDFREGWQSGIDESVSLALYRQPYCGCIYSEQERYDNRYKKKMTKEKNNNV